MCGLAPSFRTDGQLNKTSYCVTIAFTANIYRLLLAMVAKLRRKRSYDYEDDSICKAQIQIWYRCFRLGENTLELFHILRDLLEAEQSKMLKQCDPQDKYRWLTVEELNECQIS